MMINQLVDDSYIIDICLLRIYRDISCNGIFI